MTAALRWLRLEEMGRQRGSVTSGRYAAFLAVALASQSYREFRPPAALAPYVGCFWQQQVAETGPSYHHRTVPHGCVEIVCRLGTDILTVIGPQQEAAIEELSPGSSIVGVRVALGSAPALLGISTDQLLGCRINLSAFWGRDAAELGKRLSDRSLDDATRLVAAAIAARTRDARPIDTLVVAASHALQPWATRRTRDLSNQLYLSPRQLRRRFLTATGYSPKTLQRLLRFQAFLALSDHSHEDTLAQLASCVCYSDQAHLSRESLMLGGLPPRQLLASIHRDCTSNHDHRASYAPTQRRLAQSRSSFRT